MALARTQGAWGLSLLPAVHPAGEQDSPPGPAPLRGLPRTGAGVPLWAEGACFALLAVAAVGVLLFVYLQRPHHGLVSGSAVCRVA